jgi:uncharacterized protein (DUF2267 family)
VRGLYFEGWNPSQTPTTNRSCVGFLGRVEHALELALWNEDATITPETAARAVLGVLSERVSRGEIDRVRHVLPEKVRALWPELPARAGQDGINETAQRAGVRAAEK